MYAKIRMSLLALLALASIVLGACGATTTPAPAATPEPDVISTLVAGTQTNLPTTGLPTETHSPTWPPETVNCGPVVWDNGESEFPIIPIKCDNGIVSIEGINDTDHGVDHRGKFIVIKITASRDVDFMRVYVQVELTQNEVRLPSEVNCHIENWIVTQGEEYFLIGDKTELAVACHLGLIGLNEFLYGTISIPLPTSELASWLTASPTPTATTTPTP